MVTTMDRSAHPYTAAERINKEVGDVREAHALACEMATSIERPDICTDICVFEDGSKLKFEACRMIVLD
ncbi:hypothetical protein [Burkholderia vietnamiensis]|uniref:Uncharacterized protein n=1 Tax=Burkholderia contaminans TaxID=488447 RepID=A0A2S5DMC0_9BURK|nr:hypothetical protein [Burkholderia vietnamiensis]KVR89508.1 hypothetical protein WK28_24160 [Burkholderia vietnamiensis]MBR8205325.1 hypothetical protein [Burkholderia vietnamiensis]POZ80232.1 hypothetical protein C3743_40370 [Burkholderia contaminans]HDR9133247.1 hypothetical protein [Burkholderia vietnamiensis]